MLSLFIFTALVGCYIVKYFLNIKKYPPGPFPLPLIGNGIAFFGASLKPGGIRPILHEWTKKYGPVFTVWLGPIPVVYINDFEIAQESMVKKGSMFVDRQYLFMPNITRNEQGIIFSNGHQWSEQRRFALHTLRDFGLGRNLMEERIMLEFDYRSSLLDKEICKAGGKLLWNPSKFSELTIGNIINRILFSDRFTDEKETEFFQIKERMEKKMEDNSIIDAFLRDWNKDWPLFNRRYKTMRDSGMAVVDFIKDQIDQKKRDRANGAEVSEDFVDIFLNKIDTGEYSENFNENSLAITLFDLWIAGQETTSTALYWGIAYLVRYPELQKELDAVTRGSHPISLADRPKTPYLNAVVQETLRVSSFFPVNILAKLAAEDVEVSGYFIPKGTATVMQMGVIMSDATNFKDPYEFNPDRYFNGESEQRVVPFGLGKRACIGESLARAELYLIMGNLALFYNLEGISNKLPKMEAQPETFVPRKAAPYELYVSKR